MAIYAVGDLQGCLHPLLRLLEKIRFDPVQDRLWLVGDLVNRGPHSGECLRFLKDLGPAAISVLGNHDLHLIATAAGIRPARPRDTLEPLLQRADRDELLDWLVQRPLLHHDAATGWTLVHAGIPPQWDLAHACAATARVEAMLRDPAQRAFFLPVMYGDEPTQWHEDLPEVDRLRYTINACTRMRFLHTDGRLNFTEKGPPEMAPRYLLPWFAYPRRTMRDQPIVFGHWSALGFRRQRNWMSLDTGCVWGQQLTLVRLEQRHPATLPIWHEPCA